nr:ATP-dependent helicase [uncultured bacterium]
MVVLEPRRVAARAAAWRMADECGTPLGREIGYQVRFERQAGRDTRVLVVTEGIFVRMLADDPFLEHVASWCSTNSTSGISTPTWHWRWCGVCRVRYVPT